MDPTSKSDLAQNDHQPTSTIVDEGEDYAPSSGITDAEPQEVKSELTQAADRVRALYTSGVPFFTKHSIADLAGQLDRARKQYQHQHASEGNKKGDGHVQMLTLQALDGKTVEIENDIGDSWPIADSILERVMVDFSISYNTYQHLIRANKDPDRFSPKFAYCALRVHYHGRERDTTTNEFLPEPAGQSVEATQVAFNAGVKAWEESEECKRLTAALMTNTTPDKITKVVAFACCTMSGREIYEESITQHALILTIRDILQKKNLTAEEEIKCYAQDPVYRDVDRAVLEGAGIHILEDPHGFLEVDDSSAVISFAPNVPVRQIVADIARPAIMIWNKVTPEEEMIQSWSHRWEERAFESVEHLEGGICDPESSRLRELIQEEYVEIQELSEDIFGDSCVYVRRCSDF